MTDVPPVKIRDWSDFLSSYEEAVGSPEREEELGCPLELDPEIQHLLEDEESLEEVNDEAPSARPPLMMPP